MSNLKNIRESKGISQAAVARELNISRQTYNNYELGKREADYETLLKLAEYFGTTVDCLLGKSTTPIANADTQLDAIYLSLAKSAQDEGIDPDDIKLAIETIKAMKKQKGVIDE